MKKIICFIVTLALLLSSVSMAYAKNGGSDHKNNHEDKNHEWDDWNCYDKDQEEEQTFLIKDLTILTYGKYKIPIDVIEDGMYATVALDNAKGILTVTGRNNKVINIDYCNKTITVNGVKDSKPSVFKLKHNKNMKTLLEYLGKQLGFKITYSKNQITVKDLNEDGNTETPQTPQTTQGVITVTPVGTSVVANTFNTTTQYFTATATITAGKAAGGYAVLYVGNTAVAVDSVVAVTDTTVNFTSSDGTPTNTELQTIVPKGGNVSVKIYNSSSILINTITSDKALTVDYTAPTITSMVSAVYSVSNSTITLYVTGAGAVNDKVDVKKISLFDVTLNKTYQLTDSTGVVSSSTAITIKLSAKDKLGLASFGASNVSMYIAAGSLITDAAGNASAGFLAVQMISVTVNNNSPDITTTQSTITITPVGTSVVANTLNTTTQYFTANATITAGKAPGGYAVLYVGTTAIAVDNVVTAADTTVTFTTSDGTPTNAELQSMVPKGGAVSVNLYNSASTLISTITSNKTLNVDYVAPTISSVISAVYSKSSSTITISATGAGAVSDKVDVKKVSLFDGTQNKMYQLTDSTGVVSSSTVITIKVSTTDKLALAFLGVSDVYMYITPGYLITDSAGNTGAAFAAAQLISVTVAQ